MWWLVLFCLISTISDSKIKAENSAPEKESYQSVRQQLRKVVNLTDIHQEDKIVDYIKEINDQKEDYEAIAYVGVARAAIEEFTRIFLKEIQEPNWKKRCSIFLNGVWTGEKNHVAQEIRLTLQNRTTYPLDASEFCECLDNAYSDLTKTLHNDLVKIGKGLPIIRNNHLRATLRSGVKIALEHVGFTVKENVI